MALAMASEIHVFPNPRGAKTKPRSPSRNQSPSNFSRRGMPIAESSTHGKMLVLKAAVHSARGSFYAAGAAGSTQPPNSDFMLEELEVTIACAGGDDVAEVMGSEVEDSGQCPGPLYLLCPSHGSRSSRFVGVRDHGYFPAGEVFQGLSGNVLGRAKHGYGK